MEWVAQSDVDADLARRLIAAQFPEVAFRSITRLGAAHRFREAAGNVLARAPFHPAGLPGDELGRLDHAKRMPLARERFGELVQAGALGDASAFVAFLEEHPAGPRPARAASYTVTCTRGTCSSPISACTYKMQSCENAVWQGCGSFARRCRALHQAGGYDGL